MTQRHRATQVWAEIRRALQRLGTPAHLLDDMTQEVFLALLSDQAEGRPPQPILRRARTTRGKLRSGEYRIERQTIHDKEIDDDRHHPPRQEDQFLVSELLRGLTKTQREVISLIYFEGLKNPEVARRLGKTTNAIAGIKRAARKRAAKLAMHDLGARRHIVSITPRDDVSSFKARWNACLGAGLYGFSSATTPDDELLVVGWSHGPVVIGGARSDDVGPLPWNLWLVRARPGSAAPSILRVGSAVDPREQSIVLLDAQRLVLAALFEGAVELAGKAPQDNKGAGVMIACLDLRAERCAFAHVRPFGRAQSETPSLVVDAQGNLVVACVLRKSDSADYVLRLDRFDQEGASLRCWEYLCSGEARGWTVSAAGDGLLVAGVFDGKIDFASGHKKEHRSNELFMAKLDASGACVWLRSFRGSRGQPGWAACADSEGSVFLAAYFNGDVDWSNPPLKSKSRSGYDLVFARLSASGGNVLWSAQYPGTAAPLPLSIAASDGGCLLVVGYLDGMARASSRPPNELGGDAGRGEGDPLHLAKLGPSGDLRGITVVARAPGAIFGNEISPGGAGGFVLSVYRAGEEVTELYVVSFAADPG